MVTSKVGAVSLLDTLLAPLPLIDTNAIDWTNASVNKQKITHQSRAALSFCAPKALKVVTCRILLISVLIWAFTRTTIHWSAVQDGGRCQKSINTSKANNELIWNQCEIRIQKTRTTLEDSKRAVAKLKTRNFPFGKMTSRKRGRSKCCRLRVWWPQRRHTLAVLATHKSI